PGNRSRPHRHDFYQIFWLTQGERSFTIDFDNFPVRAPSFVFVPPGAVHTFGTLESTNGYMLSFQQDFLEAHGYSIDLFQDCPVFDPAHFRVVLQVSHTAVQRVTGYVEEIFAEFNAKQHQYQTAMAAFLRLLFVEIKRAVSNQAGSNSHQKYSALTARFLRRLNSRPYQIASASEVSKLLGVSRSWLNELVRKEPYRSSSEKVHLGVQAASGAFRSEYFRDRVSTWVRRRVLFYSTFQADRRDEPVGIQGTASLRKSNFGLRIADCESRICI